MINRRFYDTCSFLEVGDFALDTPFILSYITLLELEHIKNDKNKDPAIKYKAKKMSHLLDNNPDLYDVCYQGRNEASNKDIDVYNDSIIAGGAFYYSQKEKIDFFSDDVSLKNIARKIFGLSVYSVRDLLKNQVEYTGYKIINADNEYLNDLYASNEQNYFNCLTNEYIVVINDYGEVSDIRKWNGVKYSTITRKTIKNTLFDKISPKDEYQQMVIDSIFSNSLTAISGGAGSGKTLLALSTAMSLVDTGKYNRIVVLFNPTTTKGAAAMGYYSGNMIEKAKQSNVGNMLSSKFGDETHLDRLIMEGKIKLLSVADCRGWEGNNEILLFSECQNTDANLLKLCLSRASESCKVIIEGDFDSQVDSQLFENNNGMKAAINAFKGEDIFGYVKLKNIYRSRVAKIADNM